MLPAVVQSQRDRWRAGCRRQRAVMTRTGTDGGPTETNGGTENRCFGFHFPLWVWLLYAAGLVLLSSVIGVSYWMGAGRSVAAVPGWPCVGGQLARIVLALARPPPG